MNTQSLERLEHCVGIFKRKYYWTMYGDPFLAHRFIYEKLVYDLSNVNVYVREIGGLRRAYIEYDDEVVHAILLIRIFALEE
jgi:hypothetical protein